MGVVYEAEDTQLRRPVAIKMLHAALADKVARERAAARGTDRRRHQSPAHLPGVRDRRARRRLVHRDGTSRRRVALRAPAPAVRCASMRRCEPRSRILGALQELHDRGVVHRDLKPSNVMLSAHGCKLLDFGLARPVVDEGGDRLTQTGMFVGTPGFMAPEQFGGGEVGPAADLFAAGALTLEMIAGTPAFPAESAAQGFHAVLHEQPPVLTGGPAVCEADRILQCAMSKEAKDRPASASEMADALQGAAAMADGTESPGAVAIHRVMVIPFKLLREDSEIDFLPIGLADALNTSLAGIDGLVVKASQVGAPLRRCRTRLRGPGQGDGRATGSDRNVDAGRRSPAGLLPVDGDSGRIPGLVRHVRRLCGQPVCAAGRDRSAHRRLAGAGNWRRHANARCKATSRRTRRRTSATCAPTSWPTTSRCSTRPGSSTRRVSNTIRAMRRHGPSSGASCASWPSTATPKPSRTSRTPRLPSSARLRSTRVSPRHTTSTRTTRSRKRASRAKPWSGCCNKHGAGRRIRSCWPALC